MRTRRIAASREILTPRRFGEFLLTFSLYPAEKRWCRRLPGASGHPITRLVLRLKSTMNKPIGIKTISKSAHIRIIVVSLLLLSGCQSLYYKTMSKLGKEKRDILVARVKESKKDQEKTKEQIQTTMEKFQ